MSPGRRPSFRGNAPGRAASHTNAPTAASAAPAKTSILPISRIGSITRHFNQIEAYPERRAGVMQGLSLISFLGILCDGGGASVWWSWFLWRGDISEGVVWWLGRIFLEEPP